MSLRGNVALQVRERIEVAREKNGARVPLEDVESLVDSLIDGIVAETGAETRQVAEELREVLEYVMQAKQEFMALGPRALSAKEIPDASDELNAILGATEEAAGQIMDAADKVGELAATTDGPMAEELQNISTGLYEASSFQDICGQRITKVMGILKFLEGRLTNLAETLGGNNFEVDDEVAKFDEDEAVKFDEEGLAVDPEKLLHGPQLDGGGNSQGEIDALMADFD